MVHAHGRDRAVLGGVARGNQRACLRRLRVRGPAGHERHVAAEFHDWHRQHAGAVHATPTGPQPQC